MQLNERTLSSDISPTETKLDVETVFQQLRLPSLPRLVFKDYEVKSLHTKVFGITDRDDSSDQYSDIALKSVSNDLIIPYDSQQLRTRITLEAMEDFETMYGDPASHIAKMLKGVCNQRENNDFIKFLKEKAYDDEDLKLSDPLNSETQMFEITNRVQRCVLRMNSKTMRTFYSYAIVPYKFVGSIMTTFAYTTGLNTTKSSELLVADLGIAKYYVNPDPNDEYCYVGLKHPSIDNLSSGFFGSLKPFIQKVDETESGNKVYFIFNRYAMCTSPLHEEENPMILKFKISL